MYSDCLDKFEEKTTKAFDIIVTNSGLPVDFIGTVEIIFKVNKTDFDVDAVIKKEASSYDGNIARFVLTPTDTAITPRKYFYEIKYTSGTDVYILQSSTVEVLERVWD